MSKKKKNKTTLNEGVSTFNEHQTDAPIVEAPVDPYADYEDIGQKDGIQYLKNKTGYFYVNPNKNGAVTGLGKTLSPELKAQLA